MDIRTNCLFGHVYGSSFCKTHQHLKVNHCGKLEGYESSCTLNKHAKFGIAAPEQWTVDGSQKPFLGCELLSRYAFLSDVWLWWAAPFWTFLSLHLFRNGRKTPQKSMMNQPLRSHFCGGRPWSCGCLARNLHMSTCNWAEDFLEQFLGHQDTVSRQDNLIHQKRTHGYGSRCDLTVPFLNVRSWMFARAPTIAWTICYGLKLDSLKQIKWLT